VSVVWHFERWEIREHAYVISPNLKEHRSISISHFDMQPRWSAGFQIVYRSQRTLQSDARTVIRFVEHRPDRFVQRPRRRPFVARSAARQAGDLITRGDQDAPDGKHRVEKARLPASKY
jgi:hypothetical protein